MSKNMPTRRKRVSKAPEVRREELLEAASALFLERWVSGTGIGDITDRAKVARGTFYLYFSSKDDVIAELWKRYVVGYTSLTDKMLEEENRVMSDGRLILELMSTLTRHALEHAYLHRIVYGSADAAAIALCRQSDEAILKRLTDAILSYFRQTKRSVKQVELVASVLFHGLDGALHRAIMSDRPIDREAFIDVVQRFTASALEIAPHQWNQSRGEAT